MYKINRKSIEIRFIFRYNSKQPLKITFDCLQRGLNCVMNRLIGIRRFYMRIRKRYIAMLVLPTLTLAMSILITNDNPASRREQLSIFLIFLAFAQFVVYSPFLGYFAREGDSVPRTASIYYLMFLFCGFIRMLSQYPKLYLEEFGYSDIEKMLWIIIPPVTVVVSVVLFLVGAYMFSRRNGEEE